MPAPEKIARTFVREEAYHLLLKWITEGQLAPGQKLRDADLAMQLGVSRTPIREALLRLEDEGLVVTTPNRSTQVSPIDFHDALNLYSIVWSLEALALRQAFSKINEEHIQAMRKENENLLQALQNGDCLLAQKADHAFHDVFLALSGNMELYHIVASVKQKLKRIEYFYFDTAKHSHLSYQEHLAIIEALCQKDLSGALHAIESNWKGSFDRLK